MCDQTIAFYRLKYKKMKVSTVDTSSELIEELCYVCALLIVLILQQVVGLYCVDILWLKTGISLQIRNNLHRYLASYFMELFVRKIVHSAIVDGYKMNFDHCAS